MFILQVELVRRKGGGRSGYDRKVSANERSAWRHSL
jgi:hypothetical protein